MNDCIYEYMDNMDAAWAALLAMYQDMDAAAAASEGWTMVSGGGEVAHGS